MALSPDIKFALVAGGIVVTGGLGIWALLTSRTPKAPPQPPPPAPGKLLCPADVGRDPAPAMSVGRGDFIVIQVQSGDGKFSEATWATVLAKSDDTIFAAITGEQVEEGVRTLQTDKHGFRLGQTVLVTRDCIWEVFKPERFDGDILCGPQIRELAEFLKDDNLYPIAAGRTVEVGDRVQIVVGSKESFGNAWHEKLWTRIITISPSGQVITAMVDSEPEVTEHGLARGSIVRFNRDCVIGV